MKSFIKLYRPHLALFLTVLFFALIVGVIDLLIPNFTSMLINNGIEHKDMNFFAKLAILMLVLFIIKAILTYMITFYGHMVGVKIEFTLRSNLFKKITSLPIKFFDNTSVGKMMSHLTNDLNEISEVAHHGPENLLMMIVFSMGALIIMFFMNLQLTIAILVFIPIVVVINIIAGKPFYRTNMQLKVNLADINSQANDAFSGIRQVKAFVNEDYEAEMFDKNNDQFLESKRSMYKVMAKYFGSLDVYFGAMTLMVIIYGGYIVYQGNMNIGELTAFIMYVNLFKDPIMKFSNFITEFNKATTGYTRYLRVMELPSQFEYPDAKDIDVVKGDIEFKNVWFRYDEESEYVIKDFNLKINAGESIAFVGESGVGKSTICNLINRYYEIDEGEITIDGVNINEYTLTSLRKNLGLVTQDVYIFSGTIYENILYGDLEKSEEEVVQAARHAHLSKLIAKLPDGFASYIGERGTKLSGGQKQRISLARVFLKNPNILILDEATSALDNETEKEIQKVIDEVSKNKTNLIVAHRLSTIKDVNRIVVMGKEGVLEIGSHDELMAKKGHYYSLYTMH